jgi:hypothetical protein
MPADRVAATTPLPNGLHFFNFATEPAVQQPYVLAIVTGEVCVAAARLMMRRAAQLRASYQASRRFLVFVIIGLYSHGSSP